MYCRKCRYDLAHLEAATCPECGAPFDRGDASTFYATLPGRFIARVILLAFLVGGFVVYGVITTAEVVLDRGYCFGEFVLVVIAFAGAVVAGRRADVPITFLVYGFPFTLPLFGRAVAERWITEDREIAVLLEFLAWTLVVAGIMVACRFVGGWSWRRHNRRLAGLSGRARATGRRIRRGRWLRPRNVAIVVLLLLVAGPAWVVVETARVMNASPNVAVDYRAQRNLLREDLAGVDERTGRDAWLALTALLDDAQAIIVEQEAQSMAAFEPREDFDGGALDFARVLRGETLPPGVEREARALDAMRAAGIWSRLAGFAGGPMALRPPPPDPMRSMIMEALPYLALARGVAKARGADMRLAANAGDFDAVAAAFDELLALAETVSHQGTIIDWLVGAAVTALATEELDRELMELDFDEDTCRRLQATLERRTIASTVLPLEGERAALMDALQRMFTDDGNGDGYLIPGAAGGITGGGAPGGPDQLFEAFLARFWVSSRREQTALLHRFMDACLAEAQLAPHERDLAALDFEALEAKLTMRDGVVPLLIPAVTRFLQQDAIVRSQLQGTRVLVAIERLRARYGHPPASLEALVPDVLPVPPVDPLNGEPFGYRRLETDAEGRGFRLYSLGRDGVDDGGTFDVDNAGRGWDDDEDVHLGLDVPIGRARDPVMP